MGHKKIPIRASYGPWATFWWYRSSESLSTKSFIHHAVNKQKQMNSGFKAIKQQTLIVNLIICPFVQLLAFVLWDIQTCLKWLINPVSGVITESCHVSRYQLSLSSQVWSHPQIQLCFHCSYRLHKKGEMRMYRLKAAQLQQVQSEMNPSVINL